MTRPTPRTVVGAMLMAWSLASGLALLLGRPEWLPFVAWELIFGGALVWFVTGVWMLSDVPVDATVALALSFYAASMAFGLFTDGLVRQLSVWVALALVYLLIFSSRAIGWWVGVTNAVRRRAK